MSTDIRASFASNGDEFASIYRFEGERVDIGVTRDGKNERAVGVTRADFLAAVEAECGVIIIDRAELPEVQQPDLVARDKHFEASGEMTPGRVRDQAMKLLALAEYLDAHPPIDPEQVAALADAIDNIDKGHRQLSPDDLARALLATGRIEVKR